MPKGVSGYAFAAACERKGEEKWTRLTSYNLDPQTPPGHERACSHLIRRFDTEALSASSLFRVAFPTASDAAEYACRPRAQKSPSKLTDKR